MAGLEHRLGLGFLGAMDVNLRFDDRHQAGGQDLRGEIELLIDYFL